MQDTYTSQKQALIKTTSRVMLIPLILLIFLVTIFARIALRTGANNEWFSLMPSGDAAFKIAKDYIWPTLRWSDYHFADDYTLSKGSGTDSIYVLRSFYQITQNNENLKTHFTIRLKYDGGDKEDTRSWSELNFDEQ